MVQYSIYDLLRIRSKTLRQYLMQEMLAKEQTAQDAHEDELVDVGELLKELDKLDEQLSTVSLPTADTQDDEQEGTDTGIQMADEPSDQQKNKGTMSVTPDDRELIKQTEEETEEADREKDIEQQLEQIKQDIERLKLLDRLRFLITAVPKLELVIMSLPGYVAEKDPLLLVYMLDKLTEIKYLINYLIANVDKFDYEVLDKILTELESFIEEMVQAAVVALKGGSST